MRDEARQKRFQDLREAAEQGTLSSAERAEWAALVQDRCHEGEAAVVEAARQTEEANAVLAALRQHVQAQNHELAALLQEQEAHLTEVQATIGRMEVAAAEHRLKSL